jgi:hypothetical protein
MVNEISERMLADNPERAEVKDGEFHNQQVKQKKEMLFSKMNIGEILEIAVY